MSLGESDGNFPSQSSGALPPSPSRENPGQVYPKSDPQAAPAQLVPGTGGEHQPKTMTENSFELESVFVKLDEALSEIISVLESEQKSVGSTGYQQATLQRMKSWRMELDHLRAGNHTVYDMADGTPQDGGLFTD